MLRHSAAILGELAPGGVSVEDFEGLPVSIVDRLPQPEITLASLVMSGEFPWSHFVPDATPDGTGLTCTFPDHTVVVRPGDARGWHGDVVESRAERPGCLGKQTVLLEAGRIGESLSTVVGKAIVRLGAVPPEDWWP